MFEAQVATVPMASPDDVTSVADLFERGILNPAHVVAVIAQTEGNGFARGYCSSVLQQLLAQWLGVSVAKVAEDIPILVIGGTAGLMSPHITLFANKPATSGQAGNARRLVIGVGTTRTLLPEEYGTVTQVGLVADCVRDVTKAAGLSNSDVVCVQLKCPQMTAQRMKEAASRGQKVADPNPQVVSSRCRGACALGAAVALGEVEASAISESAIGRRPDLYTSRGSASSGTEQRAVRVIVLGNVDGAPGDYVAACGVMADAIDARGAQDAFERVGLRLDGGIVAAEEQRKVAAVFINAGANAVPTCAGHRHTMNSDFLSAFAGHQAKAVAHAVVSTIAQNTLILASAGAEHQGAPGSSLVCVIANHGRGQ